jgi:hypothetical protein
MPEEPFRNREILEMFADVKKDLLEIFEQTSATNGSIADINRWRERMNGAVAASGVFMTVVVIPILAWSIYTLTNIDRVIHKSVDEALSAYEVKAP